MISAPAEAGAGVAGSTAAELGEVHVGHAAVVAGGLGHRGTECLRGGRVP